MLRSTGPESQRWSLKAELILQILSCSVMHHNVLFHSDVSPHICGNTEGSRAAVWIICLSGLFIKAAPTQHFQDQMEQMKSV